MKSAQDNTLVGRRRVVAADRYDLVIHIPPGDRLKSAEAPGQPADAVATGELARVAWTPAATADLARKVVSETMLVSPGQPDSP
jgi:hypothetical protein